MRKGKKVIYTLTLVGVSLLGYFFWHSMQPVEIIAIHQRDNYSDVLVNHFPFTDKGKINWWLDNKEILKEKYDIPKPDSDGFFTIIFWDFGDGYKEAGKYDRMCFEDMKEKENCIEKNVFFIAENDRDNDMLFVGDGGRYLMKKNGQIIKLRRD
ncbi:DUF943 family protein [Serratia rubidaea]|uniref:DUF943 family protein n=1 Tax=Serratia rubidaea TaxID=61652 RepID=UPI0022B93743|nr:DUF943 family protein [Serratia rubidaea]WBF45681.1 DUF943 family protein [Serratia rubidaea]